MCSVAFLLERKEKAVLLLWKACYQLNSSTFLFFPSSFLFHFNNPYKSCCCWTLLESQGEPVQVPGVRVVQVLVLCVLYLLQGVVLLPRALGSLGHEHSLLFPSVVFK